MTWELIIQFLALTTIISGALIFVLHRVFVSSVEGAKQRLERDAEAARAREAELNRKIKQADDELAARKRELDQLEQKMKGQLEEEANKHKEELVNKARAEAEDIILKAQNAAEGIRRDIEKQMELRIIDYSTKILNEILSKKAKAAFEKDLVEEFIAQLQEVDMSKISLEIKKAEVVTSCGLPESDLKRIESIVKGKTAREMTFESKISDEFVAGVVIKFGSLHLDGSLRNAVRECAVSLKSEIEKGYLKKA